jgi:DNA-binding ferritin-like protein
VPFQISRLSHAHEIVLEESRTMARLAAERGDDGANDLIVSDVIRLERASRLVHRRAHRRRAVGRGSVSRVLC